MNYVLSANNYKYYVPKIVTVSMKDKKSINYGEIVFSTFYILFICEKLSKTNPRYEKQVFWSISN